jgi:GDPmannose 4,6-dehydratase
MKRAALLTGITGQDGSYLAELLLNKGYDVYGILRRTSIQTTERIQSILSHPCLFLREADMGDSPSLQSVVAELVSYERIEIYNLAAQSHVHTSFRQPEYTADVDGLGPLRLLESVRALNLISKVRFYQASTSELFGKVVETPQTETTPFYPRSPYGVAKLYAYWIVKNYRESYGMFACNGILFNHESERRGSEFVTRKITLGVAKSIRDTSYILEIGNLDVSRDWGHAEDYVYGMWLMLQQDQPADYVLSTGTTHTVREFVEASFKCINISLTWVGSGLDEKGLDSDGRVRVAINPAFYRPCEVDLLVGDSSLARNQLGWYPRISFEELVSRMVRSDTL